MKLTSLFTTVLGLGVLLASCGPRPDLEPITPTEDPWANYSLGEIRNTPTGGEMIEWFGRAGFLPGFVLEAQLDVQDIGEQPPSDAGTWVARYLYVSGTCTGGKYLLTNPKYYEEEIGIVISEDGSIPCAKPVVQFEGSKAGRTWATPAAVGRRVFRSTPYIEEIRPDAIRWEILYGGRSGNEVTLDYREFAYDPALGTFARPAFYQQVKYDLSSSHTITFRDVRIEILDASNSGIRFKVMADGQHHQAFR